MIQRDLNSSHSLSPPLFPFSPALSVIQYFWKHLFHYIVEHKQLNSTDECWKMFSELCSVRRSIFSRTERPWKGKRKKNQKIKKEKWEKTDEEERERIYLIAIIIWDEIRNENEKSRMCESERRNEINIHFLFTDNKTKCDSKEKKCSHRYSNFKLFFFRRRRHCCCVFVSFCLDSFRQRCLANWKEFVATISKLGNDLQNNRIIFVLYGTVNSLLVFIF